MKRRDFHLAATGAFAAALAVPACSHPKNWGLASGTDWGAGEPASGGRLGVAVLRDGRMEGHRLDERFAMCSTFKWLAAAHVLHRVDLGLERLDRRVEYGPEVLLPHSPLTAPHAGRGGMTIGQLCEATVGVSDNAAGNLVLSSFGGPQGLTAFVRGLGDNVTRLDRYELKLNEAEPGDPRDTTTPRAMAQLLHACLVGDALSPRSREQLVKWMEAVRTNTQRLRADLPAGWRMGSKTGTGDRGTTNDVGIFWPPGQPPVIVAVYLTNTTAPVEARNAAIAQVARRVTRG